MLQTKYIYILLTSIPNSCITLASFHSNCQRTDRLRVPCRELLTTCQQWNLEQVQHGLIRGTDNNTEFPFSHTDTRNPIQPSLPPRQAPGEDSRDPWISGSRFDRSLQLSRIHESMILLLSVGSAQAILKENRKFNNWVQSMILLLSVASGQA